jgi:tetratricopeptide (TPR) repeat protein
MRQLLSIILLFAAASVFAQQDSLGYQKAWDELDAKNYSSSLKMVNKLMESEDHENFYMLRSEILTAMKEYQKSYENMLVALERFPKSFFLRNYMGVMLMTYNENSLALDELNIALELAENDEQRAMALTNRASAHTSVRAFDKAYDDLIKAHNMNPEDVSTIINLGGVCDEIGKTQEGIDFLKEALKKELTDFEKKGVLANLGFQHQNLGKYEVAIDYYNQVLAIDQNEPLGYSNRSYNRMQIGDTKGAMEDIDRSLKLYPENSYAYYVKGLIYLKMDKTKSACKEFQTAIDKGYTERYGRDVEILMNENCK